MVIKAITFDLWGTIFYNKNKSVHYKLSKYICEEMGQSYFDNLYETNTTKEQFLNDFRNFAGYSKMRKAKKMLDDLEDNFNIYSDVKYIFALKGYKTAIISNASFRTNEILKNWNKKDFFNQIVISYKVESIKPDIKIFEHTSNKLKCKPNEILHVGNDYHADYLGAKIAGYHALLIDRNNQFKDIKERINSFKDLEGYITKLNKNTQTQPTQRIIHAHL